LGQQRLHARPDAQSAILLLDRIETNKGTSPFTDLLGEVHPIAPIEPDFPGQMVCECVHGGDPDLKWEAILPEGSRVKRGAKLLVEGKVLVIRYSDTGLHSGLTIAADRVR
jgi:hypothetical protein